MISEQTIKFLIENRLNNSKEWYALHKESYINYVLNPLMELVTALSSTMYDIDQDFILEPKVDKTISRIYRDTRFSNDKSLYRDIMWIVFSKNKKLYEGYPAFFFEIKPAGFRFGVGYNMAKPDSMDSMRNLIDKKYKLFFSALDSFKAQDIFVVEGDCYKKTKFNGTDKAVQEWYDKKNICFTHNSTDFNLLFSDGLKDFLIENFKKLKIIYTFMLKIEENKKVV